MRVIRRRDFFPVRERWWRTRRPSRRRPHAAGPTLVQAQTSGQANNDTTSCTISASSAGNDLLVFVFFDGLTNVVSSITDNLNQTYIPRDTIQNNNGNDYTIACYYLHGTAAGVTSISATVTHTTAHDFRTVMVLEYSGVSGYGQIIDSFGTGVGSMTQSLTTQAANNTIVSGIFTFGTYTSTSGTIEANTSLTGLSIGTANVLVSDKSAATINTSVTNSGTMSGSGGNCQLSVELSSVVANFVQTSHAFGGSSQNTTTPALPFAAMTPQSTLVACLFWKGAVTVSSVTTNNGDTLVDSGAGKLARPVDGNLQIYVDYTPTVNSTIPTLSVNLSGTPGASSNDYYFCEFWGLASVDTFATGTATSGTTVTSGSFSTSQSNELILAWASSNVNNITTSTVAGSAMFQAQNVSGQGELVGNLVVSSVSSGTCVVTFNATVSKAALIVVAFKPITPTVVATMGEEGGWSNPPGTIMPAGNSLRVFS